MRSRRGIGRTEIIIGVVVVVIIAAVAVPLVMRGSDKSREVEVPLYVESIRTAEIQMMEVFEEYISADAAPRAPSEVDEVAVVWEGTPGFNELSWSPDNLEEVFGSYRVVKTETGFTVIGVADVDGDGKRAEYSATESTPAEATSNPDFR